MNGDLLSHGLWEASAPAAPDTRALTGSVAVDVAVIGGGFIGSSAALHLAQGGASVAVLEAHDIGFGASGRNVGLVNAGMWVMPAELVNQLGPVLGNRLLDALGDGPSLVFDLIAQHDIDCEAVRTGTLHCAVGRRGADEVAERCRQWLERSAPVDVLSAEQTARLTGTRAYSAALLDRRAGTVQPLAYVRGLAGAALRKGADFYTQTRVTIAERVADSWRLTAASGAELTAKWVIVATDVYTGANGPWPRVGTQQIFLPYFNVATAPLRATWPMASFRIARALGIPGRCCRPSASTRRG